MNFKTCHIAGRDNNITFIRTMAMILVVLGHSLSPFINNFRGGGETRSWYLASTMWSIIYTFHMPLFMSVSGYLFYYEIERSMQLQIVERIRSIVIFIDKKIWRLVVPFILVMYLWRKPWSYLTGTQNMPKSIKEMLMFHTTGPLWYLYVLFAIFVFEKLFMWIIWARKNYVKIALVCMFVLAYWGYFMNGAVHHFMVYNFYFFIGIVINEHFDKLLKIRKTTINFLCILTICLTSFQLFFKIEEKNILMPLLSITIALTDIVIIYFLTSHLRNSQISELISVMDHHGMGIYLFHTEFIQVLALITVDLPRELAWLCTFFVSFLLAFLLTYLLKKMGVKMILDEFKSGQK